MDTNQTLIEADQRQPPSGEGYSGATDVVMVADTLGIGEIPILNLILLLVLLPLLVSDLIRMIPRVVRALRDFASLLDPRPYMGGYPWW